MIAVVLVVIALCGELRGVAAQESGRIRKKDTGPHPSTFLPLEIDVERIRANGIAIRSSRHLILITDVRQRADVDELATVFDHAVPLWCDYFGIDQARLDDWKLTALVMGDRRRFVQSNLIPADLPDFPAGFQRGYEMWVYLQPGNYYTRHLLLHEGTHSFMQWFLGGTGPPWYSEGMAELLAVHRWQQGRLTLNHRLSDRRQAEYWGRIKLIQDDSRNGKLMTLAEVFDIPGISFRDVRSYAWSWAACQFLSSHELSQEAFKRLPETVRQSGDSFNHSMIEALLPHRAILDRDWMLFVQELDFGYDVRRSVLHAIEPLEIDRSTYRLATDVSWQKTSFQVQADERLKITATGRFIVAYEDGAPWPCEATGVTIQYYRGQPLGCLVVGVLVDTEPGENPILPLTQDADGWWNCSQSGTICLRVNESPARMFDNQGELTVRIER